MKELEAARSAFNAAKKVWDSQRGPGDKGLREAVVAAGDAYIAALEPFVCAAREAESAVFAARHPAEGS